MKIKLVWEEKDIIPGRKFRRPEENQEWMIGYTIVNDETIYRLIAMNDGKIPIAKYTKSTLLIMLNSYGYVPSEFFCVVENIGDFMV